MAKRRGVNPTTCARIYTEEEIAFMTAMAQQQKQTGHFLSDAEILAVAYNLGYRKIAPPECLPGMQDPHTD